jgi:hypothetical protein
MTRREATRCTRQLLKGKIPMPKIPRGASAKQELGTLRRWIREMGARTARARGHQAAH